MTFLKKCLLMKKQVHTVWVSEGMTFLLYNFQKNLSMYGLGYLDLKESSEH